MEPFLGMIILVPYNFAPRGWAFCNGQILPIAQNTALFSLLGTTYGGNGQTTFALPNLQGRTAISSGQGAGLPFYSLGEMGGAPNTSLLTSNLPTHNHTIDVSAMNARVNVKGTPGNTRNPVNALPAMEAAGVTAMYSSDLTPGGQLASNAVTLGGQPTIGLTGNGLPFSTQDPFLVLNYCIALEGIFPSRN
jgi:microcystin-dependent protein